MSNAPVSLATMPCVTASRRPTAQSRTVGLVAFASDAGGGGRHFDHRRRESGRALRLNQTLGPTRMPRRLDEVAVGLPVANTSENPTKH